MNNIQDTFNLNAVNHFYQKISFDLFSKERTEEEKLEIEFNNQTHIMNIQDLIQKIEEFCVTEKINQLEKDVKNKIILIETVEDILKNFLFSFKATLPEDSKVEEIKCDIPLIREKLLKVRSTLDNLEAQSIDTVKKMKSEYEKGNEMRLVEVYEKLQLKIKELKELAVVLEEKNKVLIKKETIIENTKTKVYKNELDIKHLSENLLVSLNDNSKISEEISLISEKLKRLSEDVNLEGNFFIKKRLAYNLGNFNLYSVFLKQLENSNLIDKKSLEVFKKALSDRNKSLKNYEILNMLKEDSKMLTKRHNETKTHLNLIKSKWQGLLSSLLRIYLNKVKIKKLRAKLEENDKLSISLNSINFILNEISLNETNLNKCLEVLEPLKVENKKLNKLHQRRIMMLKKLESN